LQKLQRCQQLFAVMLLSLLFWTDRSSHSFSHMLRQAVSANKLLSSSITMTVGNAIPNSHRDADRLMVCVMATWVARMA
jgi:hypothetical protein